MNQDISSRYLLPNLSIFDAGVLHTSSVIKIDSLQSAVSEKNCAAFVIK
ncbi:hypothetical protein MM221_05590 [Salipaludibacillus sp. LMS25]|nr:hypothetical protein [Salipaludibacillus sp. LMS25]UTR16033.1 hypothetical protein MM221_05590 [Salipaludibacillus sp. LMS25]